MVFVELIIDNLDSVDCLIYSPQKNKGFWGFTIDKMADLG